MKEETEATAPEAEAERAKAKAELASALVGRLQAGPFGASHLRGLAEALATETPPPRWSRIHALLRNLALYPVVLAHGFARLAP